MSKASRTNRANRYKRVERYRTRNVFSDSTPAMIKDDMTLEMFLREIDPSTQEWLHYAILRVFVLDSPPKPPHPWPGE